MDDDVDFDPSQIYHYRGGEEIPDNVRASVVRVAIDPSVEEIPDRLFARCPRLEEVTFSEGLLKIGAWAFLDCGALRSFRSPSTVTEIGKGAFSGCLSLTVAELPPGLALIQDYTFARCTSLVKIRIPPSVARIGAAAFWDCTNLAWIEISEGLLIIGDSAFKHCRSLGKFRIPLSVMEIGWMAFDGCHSLALLRLHEDLPGLGQHAFRECPAESFRFAHHSERREAIALDTRANSELEGMLDDVATILVGATPNARECQEILRRVHGVLTDSLRENTTTLELALWKKKIDEEAERDPQPSRQECRTNSGADMDTVMRRVLEFIPSPWP